MTTTERLNAIAAKCRANLALAEERTPGEWEKDTCCAIARCDGDDPDARRHIDGGFYKIVVEGDPDSCAYIAACAGAAEAGWRSTIAAIDALRDMGESDAEILAANILSAWQ